MVIDEGPTDAFTLAAHNAFWSLSRTEIVNIAELKGIKIVAEPTLFATLHFAIMRILKITNLEAMEFVGLRLPRVRNEQHFADVLQNMDAAIEVVDRNDVDMYKGEMKAAKAAEENMETFKFEFAKCRSDLDEKMPPQKKKDCCQDSDTRQSHVPARGQSLHSSRCIHMDIKWEARVVGAHASIQESHFGL